MKNYLVVSDLPEPNAGTVQIYAAVVRAKDELAAIERFASEFGSAAPADAYAVPVSDLPRKTINVTSGLEIT